MKVLLTKVSNNSLLLAVVAKQTWIVQIGILFNLGIIKCILLASNEGIKLGIKLLLILLVSNLSVSNDIVIGLLVSTNLDFFLIL